MQVIINLVKIIWTSFKRNKSLSKSDLWRFNNIFNSAICGAEKNVIFCLPPLFIALNIMESLFLTTNLLGIVIFRKKSFFLHVSFVDCIKHNGILIFNWKLFRIVIFEKKVISFTCFFFSIAFSMLESLFLTEKWFGIGILSKKRHFSSLLPSFIALNTMES